MPCTIGIGKQDFASLREGNYFYIDKTKLISQWWESGDSVTVQAALKQIQEKQYDRELIAHGVSEDRIRCYGFAFEGKRVLIGTD